MISHKIFAQKKVHILLNSLLVNAGVAELVDAVDSKSISFKRVGVRAPPPVQRVTKMAQ